MKVIVIYSCKSGYTRMYSSWISEELKCASIDFKNMENIKIKDFDVIIFGSCLYNGKIQNIKKFFKYCDHLKNKKIIIFTVGIFPKLISSNRRILSQNFTKEQSKSYKFVYLSGGFDYKLLSFFDKCKFRFKKLRINHKLKHKLGLNAEEISIYSCFEHPTNYTRKENISQIVDYVKNLEENETV